MSRPPEGPEKRQLEIRALRHAPDAERLAEVFGSPFHADPGRHVEETEHADRGIEHEAERGRDALIHLALQHVVERVVHFAEVVDRVGDAVLDELRRHPAIALRDGLERRIVDHHVERVHVAVECLVRVLGILSGIGGTFAQPDSPNDKALRVRMRIFVFFIL